MTSLQKLLNAVRLSKSSSNKSTNSLALSDKPVAQSHNAYAVSESLYSLEAAANGKALVEERPLSHESSLYSKEQPVYSEPDMEHLVYAEVKLDDVKGSKQVSAAGFRLKGGGWYETDFKDSKKSSDKSSESTSTASADGGSKSESAKPESSSPKPAADSGSASTASASA